MFSRHVDQTFFIDFNTRSYITHICESCENAMERFKATFNGYQGSYNSANRIYLKTYTGVPNYHCTNCLSL